MSEALQSAAFGLFWFPILGIGAIIWAFVVVRATASLVRLTIWVIELARDCCRRWFRVPRAVNRLGFQFVTVPGSGYIRLAGRGIAWKDTRYWPILSSERHGDRKHWRLGHWSIATLKKGGPR